MPPWDHTAPVDPKYRSKLHRDLRAKYVRAIKAGHLVECTAEICEFDTRAIANPDGRAPDGLHLGHADNGIDYAGPQHNTCNVKDGARRGRARQAPTSGPRRRWIL